jgi:hypothetical protein
VKYDQYVTDALVHLTDSTIFERLSTDEAWSAAKSIENDIREWLTSHRKAIDKDAYLYIEDHVRKNQQSPFGQFYILYKIHKPRTPRGLATRPV